MECSVLFLLFFLIVVALVTKRTLESLLAATLLALVIGYRGSGSPRLSSRCRM